MSYLLYIAYHALFLVAAISGAYRSPMAFVVFVAACIPMATLTDVVVPAADLNWYRTVFDELSIDNVALFAIANDFEVGWAMAVLAVKSVLPEGVATLGMASMLLFMLPLLWRGVRARIEYLALLMIFPGSFLIFFNTMRQGFSEYFILSSVLSGSICLLIGAGMTHRFGYVVGLLSWLARRFSPLTLLVPSLVIALMFWRLLEIISPDNDMRAIYEQLQANYVSFAIKIVLYTLPYLAAIASRRLGRDEREAQSASASDAWRVASSAFLIIGGITIISVLVNPRLADRISFYMLPVSIWALSCAGVPRLSRSLFYVAIFALGLSSLLLGSHREFFDENVTVTQPLEHGDAEGEGE